MKDHVKLRFLFENSTGGSEVESMWAVERDGGYEIDNIPFYAKEVACGDLVAARRDDEGALWFVKLIKASGHSTLRLLFARADDVQATREELRRMGCASEVSDMPRLVGVDVPPAVDYEKVKARLQQGEHDGCFEYEEACLGFE
jgi:Domain of unknown function (DUF4265)